MGHQRGALHLNGAKGVAEKGTFSLAHPAFYQPLKENPAHRFSWHISCKITFKESFVSC